MLYIEGGGFLSSSLFDVPTSTSHRKKEFSALDVRVCPALLLAMLRLHDMRCTFRSSTILRSLCNISADTRQHSRHFSATLR